jgi:hypothetical protein
LLAAQQGAAFVLAGAGIRRRRIDRRERGDRFLDPLRVFY